VDESSTPATSDRPCGQPGGNLPRRSRLHAMHADPHGPPRPRIRIYIGDVVACAEPAILQTLLGSCVAVCLRDPVSRVGGMNHILLPGDSNQGRASRFGVHAMELLINALMQRGADRRRLVAKAFGAANVVAALRSPTVGDQNAIFVREFLARERIPLVANRLGGTHAVQIHFTTDTGRTIVHTVDGSRLPIILEAETTYRSSHFADEDFSGEVSLF
jgi:chemotaxis receptor (MCP) glutamine deamidase CheD